MIRRGAFLLFAVVVTGLLPPAFSRADAPAALDLFLVDDRGVLRQYACELVTDQTVYASPTPTPIHTETPITYEPPPTFTPPILVTPTPTPDFPPPTQETSLPTATAAPCVVTVTIPGGINKRLQPTVNSAIVPGAGLAQGWRVTLDSVADTSAVDGYLWGRDARDLGWFVLRAGSAWWVSGASDCPVAYKQ